MSTYQEEQHKIFEKLEERFKNGENPSTIVEFMDNYARDNQICLTGVVFLPQELQEVIIEQIIKPLNKIDGKQYYYVPDSFHLTIQNLKTVHEPPLFTESDIENAKKIFGKIVSGFKSFDFNLKGLLELPTSLSVRAYSSEILKDLVLNLRREMKKAGISDNKKYISDEIYFGNVTVCRYTKKPSNKFISKVKKLKKIKIGNLKTKTISLITTNIVCHPEKTKIIENYNLK